MRRTGRLKPALEQTDLEEWVARRKAEEAERLRVLSTEKDTKEKSIGSDSV
jgi:hypothetical protein